MSSVITYFLVKSMLYAPECLRFMKILFEVMVSKGNIGKK